MSPHKNRLMLARPKVCPAARVISPSTSAGESPGDDWFIVASFNLSATSQEFTVLKSKRPDCKLLVNGWSIQIARQVELLMTEILSHGAEVICVQEINIKWFDFISKVLGGDWIGDHDAQQVTCMYINTVKLGHDHPSNFAGWPTSTCLLYTSPSPRDS